MGSPSGFLTAAAALMKLQTVLDQRSVNHWCPNFKLFNHVYSWRMRITYLHLGCQEKENKKQRLHFILHAKVLPKWISQKKEQKKKR